MGALPKSRAILTFPPITAPCAAGVWPSSSWCIIPTGLYIRSSELAARGKANGSASPGTRLWTRIAAKYKQIIQEYGAEAIVLGYGTGRNYENFLYRFANLLGTPNVITAGHMCYGPRIATANIICGRMPVSDFDNNPKCVMVWGNNVVITNPDEYTART